MEEVRRINNNNDMGIFSAFTKKDQPVENRNLYDDSSLYNYLTYNSTGSYTTTRSMNLSAVYRCVEVISDAVAQLPIECSKVDQDGYKRKYVESSIYNLITKKPNNLMTRFTFIKTLITSVLLKGNGYALIERDKTGKPYNLKFIQAEFVNPQILKTGEIVYQITGVKQFVPSKDMIHILNFSYDGLVGISTLQHAKLTLGLTADSENHAAGFFKGGANLAGILKTMGSISSEQKQKIKSAWQSAFTPNIGSPNGIAVLEGNMDFQPITVNPADAQLLETRKFNVIDVCRFFGVSPIKAFDLDAANYSTVEATQLAFLTDTLAPLLEKIEEELQRKLFNEDESAVVNFDESALLRTDKTSQAEYFTKLINAGILTPSEARKQLGLPYREEADKLLIQVNMTTLKNIGNVQEDKNDQQVL